MHGSHCTNKFAVQCARCMDISPLQILLAPLSVIIEEVEEVLEIGSRWTSFLAHLGVLKLIYDQYKNVTSLRYFISCQLEGVKPVILGYFALRLGHILFKMLCRNTQLYHCKEFLGQGGSLMIASDFLALVLALGTISSDYWAGIFEEKSLFVYLWVASLIVVPVCRLVYSYFYRYQSQWANFKNLHHHAATTTSPILSKEGAVLLTFIGEQLLDISPILLARMGWILPVEGLACYIIFEVVQELVQMLVAAGLCISMIDYQELLAALRAIGEAKDMATLREQVFYRVLGGAKVILGSAALALTHYSRSRLLVHLLETTPYLMLSMKSYYSASKTLVFAIMDPIKAWGENYFFKT